MSEQLAFKCQTKQQPSGPVAESEADLKDNSCFSITLEESKWNWNLLRFHIDQEMSFKDHFINTVKTEKSLPSTLRIKKR